MNKMSREAGGFLSPSVPGKEAQAGQRSRRTWGLGLAPHSPQGALLFDLHLHLHPVALFPVSSVPWNYIIFLLGSVPVLLGRGIVTLSGKNPVLTLVVVAGGQRMIS